MYSYFLFRVISKFIWKKIYLEFLNFYFYSIAKNFYLAIVQHDTKERLFTPINGEELVKN